MSGRQSAGPATGSKRRQWAWMRRRDVFIRCAGTPDDDRAFADRLAGGREPFLPLGWGLGFAVGVQQQSTTEWAAAVLGLQEPQRVGAQRGWLAATPPVLAWPSTWRHSGVSRTTAGGDHDVLTHRRQADAWLTQLRNATRPEVPPWIVVADAERMP